MRIEDLSISISRPTPLVSMLLAALAAGEQPDAPRADASSEAPSKAAPHFLRIGEPWPGVEGTYAGIARGEDGEPDGHLVLLDAKPDGNLNWAAAVKWAQDLGEGARLPTRFESPLLYANLRDQLDTERWHWTGSQSSAGFAWNQYFNYGNQYDYAKSAEGRARAVRLIQLTT